MLRRQVIQEDLLQNGMLESRDWLMREMKKCGLDVRIDAASNLIGEREGTNPDITANHDWFSYGFRCGRRSI